jgi:hypothetical protein
MHPIWSVPVNGILTSIPIVLFDDFQTPTIGAADAAQWVATLPGTADAAASVDTLIGGGVLLTSASDAEACLDQNAGGFSRPGAGKSLFFQSRLKLASVSIANGQLFNGLGSIADVTPIAGDTSKIGLSRKTADASLWITLGDTLTDSGLDATADTFFTWGFRIRDDVIRYYIDLEQGAGPQFVGQNAISSLPAATSVLSTKLALGLSVANAQTCTWDYVLVIQDR